MSCTIIQATAVHVLVTAAAAYQGQFQIILKFRAHMPLEAMVGGGRRAEWGQLLCNKTELSSEICLSCAFTSFKICINLVLKIYIYILLVLFNNIWSAKATAARRASFSGGCWIFWGFLQPTACHAPKPVRRRRYAVCATASKTFPFYHFALVSCSFRRGDAGRVSEATAAASCLFYYKCQII